jgi:protein tyrosine phosphatase (PTP) superfamily phosphohydrolase (DUF442 family)
MERTRNVACIVALGVVLSAAFAGCRTEPDATTAASPPRKLTLPQPGETYEVLGWRKGLGGFLVKYDDRVFRGGDVLDRRGAEVLKKLGIRTILSVTPDTERELSREYGFRLVEVPFSKKEVIDPALRAKIVSVLKDGDGPIYIHCHGGTHRGGTIGMMYRLHVQGWDQKKAVDEYVRLGGDLEKSQVLIQSATGEDSTTTGQGR